MFDRIPLTRPQVRALNDLCDVEEAEPEIDPLGNPGRHGPILAFFGESGYLVMEDGRALDHDFEDLGPEIAALAAGITA